MPRARRVGRSGAWVHAILRGPSPGAAPSVPDDRRRSIRLLAEARAWFPLEIHAYCLLCSHDHLLLRAPAGDLDRAIDRLNSLLRPTRGDARASAPSSVPGRAHVVPVRSGRHAAHVSRYIHLNPVRAGLVWLPEDWEFSSYRAYLDPGRTPPWLSTAAILGWFGPIGSRRRYRVFVEDGMDLGTRDLLGRLRVPPVLESDEIRAEIRRRTDRELRGLGGPRSRAAGLDPRRAIPLAAIARVVCDVFRVPPGALRRRPAGSARVENLARGAMVHAARRLAGYPLGELAAWLGYASLEPVAAAAIRFADLARDDPSLRRRLEEIVERFSDRGRAP